MTNEPNQNNEPPVDDEDLVPEDDAIIGKAFKWSLVVFAALALVAVVIIWAVSPTEQAAEKVNDAKLAPPKVEEPGASATPPAVTFTDITDRSGIKFVHQNGAYGERLLPETMGGGVAFIDYDRDDRPDLLFVNSDYWPGHAPKGARHPTMALYHNDGGGHFTDVTHATGMNVHFYGMGAAVGDYDGDGWPDIFITAVGRNHLFHNDHGGFHEVTVKAGVAGGSNRWSTSAGFFDYDGDGDLDLFVANYVQWSRDIDLKVDYQLTGIGRAYGPPTQFAGTDSYLYRNNGDGTFTDVSAQAGIQVHNPATGEPMGKGLAIAPVDVDGDGRMDVMVANDTVQNFLFHNQGDGRFREMGAQWGLAFDRNGQSTGAMGIDAAHIHNDGSLGIAIGNFANEMTSLYVSQGKPDQFADESIIDGVGPASRLKLSFGLFFFDYDLDGRPDLFQANGHVENEIHRVQTSQYFLQPPQLFWNCGDACRATYRVVRDDESGALSRAVAGRGAAYADIDGDGDLDVVVTQVGGKPLLLRNDQALGHHWLRLRLHGRGANKDAIGARVALKVGGKVERARVMPTRSYLSQMELPVTFGLGKADHYDSLEILWPDGRKQEIPGLALDKLHQVREN